MASPAEELPKGKQRGKLRKLDLIIAEIEARLGRNADPVVTLLELAAGHDSLGIREAERMGLDPNSDQGKLMTLVPLDVRLDAAKTASRYVRPMLQQVAVTDADGNSLKPVLDIKELMRDANAVRSIEDLQIVIASRIQTQITTSSKNSLLLPQGNDNGSTCDRSSDNDDPGEDWQQHETG